MCLILFAWKMVPEVDLIVAANRDEFYGRATQSAGFWSDAQQVFGGKDLEQQGTWLGVTRTGKFAAVTNVREQHETQYPCSRGQLTADYLRGDQAPRDYLVGVEAEQHNFAGFNLLVGDGESLYYLSNRSDAPPIALSPGVYGLSNHLLNTPWPKVVRGTEGLTQRVGASQYTQGCHDMADSEQALLALLRHNKEAETAQLPETGVGEAMEKVLSPLFIHMPGYGTRASTVVHRSYLCDEEGKVQPTMRFVEQSYDCHGQPADQVRVTLDIDYS